MTKMVSLAKIYHGFNKYSSWMPKVARWKVANLTKMANQAKMTNLAIIRPRRNKLLKEAPSSVSDKSGKQFAIGFANFSN